MAISNDAKRRMPLVLDVDTGVDDAFALLLAARCPTVELLAVTCVHGNCTVDQAVENTLRVLDAAGARADLPVGRGFERALIQSAYRCYEVHGDDGLGDLKPPLPASSRSTHPDHAVKVLLDSLRYAPVDQGLTVVALGPLTNIAVAFRTDPGLWRAKCTKLVWMGGSVAAGGNSTAWGEANAFCDPEAAYICMNSGLPLVVYPWDVFLKPEYSVAELVGFCLPDTDVCDTKQEVSDGCPPWTRLAARLLHFLIRRFSAKSSTIGDAGAVVAALCPEALTLKRMHVNVELRGEFTRGMTVCDLRGMGQVEPKREPNADVAVDIDVTRVKDFFTRHVLCTDLASKLLPS
eukprot:TRINITY_DN56195_c0_g1_i1.p1 TRINITY_DN56195_c0_g1~~TRINITY_DN56195_c0_g1_i1.p1  ORF type:complete len:378 (+),score=48.86 TRINITY_DN56195_c0_g1_i1:91-1134(+)